LVFDLGEPTRAEAVLKRLMTLVPRDPTAHHNLGAVYLRADQPADAIECYRQAIQIRPDFADTWVYLGYAMEQIGALEGAMECWNQALAISPDCLAASAAIERLRRDGPTITDALTAEAVERRGEANA
jgi:protein O-GlcNAc transferase